MKTRKHNRMQMGGVILKKQQDNLAFVPTPQEEQEAFDYFFNNSNATLLSKGSKGGILFKLDLNDGIESPYVLCRSQSPWTPVLSILLKVCCFSNNAFKNEYIDLNYLTQDEFNEEVNIQKTVFYASLDENLEPICPSIIYHGLRDINEFLSQMNSITKGDEQKHIENIFVNTPFTGYGLIAMEYLEGFQPLGDLQDDQAIDDNVIHHYYYLVCFEIIRMYDLTEYLHGDFHAFNFMVNPTYPYLSNDVEFRGRAIIIDFGSSFKSQNKKIKLDHKNRSETGAESILKLNIQYPAPSWGPHFYVLNHESYQWINQFINSKSEFILTNYNIKRNRFIESWRQTIGYSVDTSSVGRFSVHGSKWQRPSSSKKGGNTMDAVYRPSATRKPPDNYAKNPPVKQQTIIKKLTKPMFPEEFTGKIAEIQQYVAMDKLANKFINK